MANSWDGYRFFLATAEAGSLKAAARHLKVNQTTVGRNISALEESLGVQLFERRSDGFVLSVAGQRILSLVREISAQFDESERLLTGNDRRLEGPIKVAMPGALANQWLVPRLGDFFQKYPRVSVDLLTGPMTVNLSRREADIAIRLVKPQRHELIEKRIGQITLRLYGHGDLFPKGVLPTEVQDLAGYRFIGLYPEATTRAELQLLDRLGIATMAKLRTAAWSSVLAALKGGLGVGILPSFMGENNPELKPVLSKFEVSMPLWMVYHSDLKNSARLRAFIDFVAGLNQ